MTMFDSAENIQLLFREKNYVYDFEGKFKILKKSAPCFNACTHRWEDLNFETGTARKQLVL